MNKVRRKGSCPQITRMDADEELPAFISASICVNLRATPVFVAALRDAPFAPFCGNPPSPVGYGATSPQLGAPKPCEGGSAMPPNTYTTPCELPHLMIQSLKPGLLGVFSGLLGEIAATISA